MSGTLQDRRMPLDFLLNDDLDEIMQAPDEVILREAPAAIGEPSLFATRMRAFVGESLKAARIGGGGTPVSIEASDRQIFVRSGMSPPAQFNGASAPGQSSPSRGNDADSKSNTGQESMLKPMQGPAQPATNVPVEISKGTLSAARGEQARSYIYRKDAYYRLKDDKDMRLADEPTDYRTTIKNYKDEIEEYFRFRIDYFPCFDDHTNALWPFGWKYFCSINDEMIERKFRRDGDIRAFVTAYRLSVHDNQVLNIYKKRIAQTLISLVALMPAVVAVEWPEVFPKFGSGSEALVGWAILIGVLIVATGLFRGFIRMTSGRLRDAFQSNAKDLSAKIQHRLNNLSQNYTTFLKRVAEEEFDTNDPENPEWTRRCKWWAQLAMWTPKRIEYIEKFLQSEMQRLRIFTLWSDVVGNLSSHLVALLTPALAFAVIYFLKDGRMSELSLEAWVSLVGGAFLGLFFGWYTRRGQASITIDNLRRWIGENEWKRFSDIGFHEDLGELIRRDKDRMRQDKLKGGFGSGGRSAHVS